MLADNFACNPNTMMTSLHSKVPSGPFRGKSRAAAVLALNERFAKDMQTFVGEEQAINLGSCMREYLGLLAEIKGS